MLSFALSHVTNDQEVNSAMMLCGTSAGMAFKASKVAAKFAHKKYKQHSQATAERLISDACSAYRGGYISTKDPEIKTLLPNMVGIDSAAGASERPFFWLGDRSDLSYFWKKTERDTAVRLTRSAIEEIPDEALRKRVVSTLTQARLEGLVTADGEAYYLTDAGKKKILNPEFIKTRLVKECEYLGVAHEGLAEMKAQMENDRIDKRLAELGRTGEFDGCDRVTINKKTLLIDDTAEDVARFVVPGTKRKKSVDLPKADLIELDADTYAAFLRKDKAYLVNGKPMQEKELFAYFDNKNKRETMRIKTAAERGEKAAMHAEKTQKADLQVGDKAYILRAVDGEPEVHAYTVERISNSPDGNHLYRLHPEDPESVDMLIREQEHGRLFFNDPETAAEYAAIAPEDVIAESTRIEEMYSAKEYMEIPARNVEQVNGEILVHPKDAPHESIVFSAGAAQMQPDGSAVVQLSSNAFYTVRTGDVSYTVSQQGAQNLLKGVSKPVSEGARVAATNAARTATNTAVKTVQTTTNVAAKAMPPVEPITASTKLIMEVANKSIDAASTVAQATTQAASLVQKL